MSSHFQSKVSYREDIQGLRALAVLSVILFHTNKEWLPGGFIGVDIFFVISGFLITSIILKQQEKKSFTLQNFFLSRVKRIIPAYCFLLATISILMAFLLTPEDFYFFKDSLESSLYFSSNHYFSNFGNYFAPDTSELPLIHTWSLAIEMQFYLFLPFLLTLTPQRFLKVGIFIIILILTVYSSYEIIINKNKQMMYFSLLARVPEFLIGSYVALKLSTFIWSNVTSNFLSAFGLALIVTSLIFINESTNFPGIMSIPTTIGTALIIATRKSFVNSLFSLPALVWVGGLSYSLYLWHWPILAGIRYYLGEYELGKSTIGLFIILTFIFAYISYRFVESAFLSQPQSSRANYSLICLIAFTAFSSLGIQFINRNIVPPLSVSSTQYAPKDKICHGKIVDDCLRGNKNSKTKILVLGDSHAAQLNLFFDVIGNSSDISFKLITASNCITIPGFDVDRLPDWARQPCVDQINIIQNSLSDYKKIIIAGMWSYHTKSQDFIQAFDIFLADTIENDLEIFVIAQIPKFNSNPVRLHRFSALNLPALNFLDESWIESNYMIMNLANKHSNTTFIDFSNSPFFDDAPFHKKVLIYSDNHHLNEDGSKKYALYSRKELLDVINRN